MADQQSSTLVIFDLDGTLIRNDSYLSFLIFTLIHKPIRVFSAIGLVRAVWKFKLGQHSNSWLKEQFLAAILAGLERSELRRLTDRFVSQLIRRHFQKIAAARLESHKNQGHRIVLASASFDFYVEQIAYHLGIEETVCTRSAWRGDKLLHYINGQNCYGEEKLNRIKLHLSEIDFQPDQVIAYSDHHSDLPLLTWANVGVAVNPTKKLAFLARQHHLTVQYW